MIKLKWACLLGAMTLALSACNKNETTEAASSRAASSSLGSPLESFSKSPLESMPAGSAGTAPALAPGMPVPPPPAINGRGYIMIDAASGKVLAESNADERMEPASLTKLMTAYIAFDALRIGRIKLTDQALVSEYAWRTGGAGTDGSTSFIPLNSRVPVETLLLGMIVQSGNDASIALAEHIAGNEDTFAQLMRQYAQRLGMTGSSFGNATGLPSPLDYTTPRDMALLAQALIRDFPQYYQYFSVKEYTYNNTTQYNRNGLLIRDPSVDGLKTGHTSGAGYCLVSSARRNDMRLITVVMNTPSIKAREDGTSALLNYGFSFYETRRLYAASQELQSARVRKGQTDTVAVGPDTDIQLTLQRGSADKIQTSIELPDSLVAPLKRDSAVGTLKLLQDGKEVGSYPLYPLADVAEAGLFGRMVDSVKLWFE